MTSTGEHLGGVTHPHGKGLNSFDSVSSNSSFGSPANRATLPSGKSWRRNRYDSPLAKASTENDQPSHSHVCRGPRIGLPYIHSILPRPPTLAMAKPKPADQAAALDSRPLLSALAATPPPSTPRPAECIGLLGLHGFLGSHRFSFVGPLNSRLMNLPRRLLGLNGLLALDST